MVNSPMIMIRIAANVVPNFLIRAPIIPASIPAMSNAGAEPNANAPISKAPVTGDELAAACAAIP